MGRNVVVLGMHRSGTSAVTGALHRLGFSIGLGDEPTAPRPANPEGNFEHLRLTVLNEQILEAQGGTWHQPPRLPSGWEHRPAARALVPRLRAEFGDLYPASPWLWKDPRACLTLPLWLQAWESTPVAVIVFRHPVAVARSLETRNGFSVAHALALWQRYSEQVLRNTSHLPLVACDYDRIFDDPAGFVRHLHDALTRLGAAPTGSVAEAAAAFEPSLRRNRAGEYELRQLSNWQLRLWQRLNALTLA